MTPEESPQVTDPAEEAQEPEPFEPEERSEQETRAGRSVLEVDAAALRVALTLYPETDEHEFTEEDIREHLAEFGISFGVSAREIRKVLNEVKETHQPVIRHIIAKGRDPVPGFDAYMEYPLVAALPREENDPQDPAEYCKRKVVNVLTGQCIAIYHPGEDGVAGVSVRDMPIPVRSGADRTPRAGRNVTKDDEELIAKVDGRLLIDPRFLEVSEELKFQEDLTIVHGDIDFVGSIIVSGNIEAGMAVKCRRNMEVFGSIIGTEIRCGGDMLVQNGIIGSDETSVEVFGNLDVGFMENATVKVHGDCVIRDNFASSNLICSGSLTLDQGNGQIVSGWAAARNGIAARTIGIELGTKVRLAVGRDLIAEEKVLEYEERVAQLEQQLEDLKQLEAKAGPGSATFRRLPRAKQEEVRTRIEERPELIDSLDDARDELEVFRRRALPKHDVAVTATRTVRADTIIEFPAMKMKLSKNLGAATFRFDEQKERIRIFAI